MAVTGDGLRVETLRPRRTLGRSVGLTVAALAAPLLVVEIWVLGARDGWSIGVLTVLVGAVLTLAAWISYRRTWVSISRYGIVERGFFGVISTVAARDVAGVLRAQLYRASSLDTTDELFVVSSSGTAVFRMRGRFWDAATMDQVAELLDAEETVRTEPVTLAELRSTDPKLLCWFERPSLRP